MIHDTYDADGWLCIVKNIAKLKTKKGTFWVSQILKTVDDQVASTSTKFIQTKK